MTVERFHPRTRADVVDALRAATETGVRVLVVGGRRHIDKGNPSAVDAELWTTQLDDLVAYEPDEMIVVVRAGMRCDELAAVLAEHGQEWPADAPPGATVGGVIASAASSPRRLRVGAVRDTVVETELVTGDGSVVKSGARTVKNVTGYDVHRLMTGSLGTLGVITQVALKVRPLPERHRMLVVHGDAALAVTVAAQVPLVAGVVATPDAVEVLLEGWRAEVDELDDAVRRLAPVDESIDDPTVFPRSPWWAWPDRGTVVEAAVAPSRIPAAVEGSDAFATLAGVGIAWIAAETDGELERVRHRVAETGGIAPALRGPGGLGGPAPAGSDVHRRLKASFDPAGILAPGREWR
jgi:glycolate oxidase FAD binding subunit